MMGEMETIRNIIIGGELPALTALLLGLIVALHPCLIATNVAAMGYIAGGTRSSRGVFLRGVAYTVGRMAGCTLLGVVLIAVVRHGVDVLSIGKTFGSWGEKLLAPVLIIIGIYLLTAHFLHRHEHCHTVDDGGRAVKGYGGCFVLGMLLSLSFCPESAIVFFGMVIPMSAEAHGGYLLPLVFAVGSAVPAVALAWCMAYGMANMAALRGKMHVVQRWLSAAVGIMFIIAGVICLLF